VFKVDYQWFDLNSDLSRFDLGLGFEFLKGTFRLSRRRLSGSLQGVGRRDSYQKDVCQGRTSHLQPAAEGADTVGMEASRASRWR